MYSSPPTTNNNNNNIQFPFLPIIMSYFFSSRRSNRQTGGFHTAMWAVKISLIITGLASFYSLARLTVPQIVSLAAAALPELSKAAKAWLAPPYLFITVHLIILVIWKLSDHKHHHHHSNTTATSSTASTYDGIGSSNVMTRAASLVLKNQTPEISPASDESCVTTESDDDDSAISASRDHHHHHHVVKKSLSVKTLVQESSMISTEEVDAHVEEQEEEEEQEDDSMDATWKAIMERTSRPSSAALSPPPSRVRVRDDSAGVDEMNRRFEDFIKKSRDQLRHQMETTNRKVY